MRKRFILAASLALTAFTALPALAQTAPSVVVRAGAHDDFDRIVFDWPRNVKFDVKRDGDRASLVFDAAADMKFSQDVQKHLTRAHGFSAQKDESGHVTVSFTVSPSANLKTFTSSTSVVLDITGKTAPAAAPVAEKSEKTEKVEKSEKTEKQSESPTPTPAAATASSNQTAATEKPTSLTPPAPPAAAK